jgi:hypothetical protein
VRGLSKRLRASSNGKAHTLMSERFRRQTYSSFPFHDQRGL